MTNTDRLTADQLADLAGHLLAADGFTLTTLANGNVRLELAYDEEQLTLGARKVTETLTGRAGIIALADRLEDIPPEDESVEQVRDDRAQLLREHAETVWE